MKQPMKRVNLVVWLGDVATPVQIRSVEAASRVDEAELHVRLTSEQIPMLRRVLDETDKCL